MRERVQPVDARRHPGDEQREEEEKGDARVEPGFGVRLVEGGGAGEGADAEEVGARGGLGGGALGGADLDVDGVGVEIARFGGRGCDAGDRGGGGGGGGFGGGGGVGSGVGCDVDFGGDGAFEGVFVEGVEEALELVPVLPHLAEGHCVDYQGEDEGDPGGGVWLVGGCFCG